MMLRSVVSEEMMSKDSWSRRPEYRKKERLERYSCKQLYKDSEITFGWPLIMTFENDTKGHTKAQCWRHTEKTNDEVSVQCAAFLRFLNKRYWRTSEAYLGVLNKSEMFKRPVHWCIRNAIWTRICNLCLVKNSDSNLDLDPEWVVKGLNFCNMKCLCCCTLSNDAPFVGIGS
jgi:hypothetical protein